MRPDSMNLGLETPSSIEEREKNPILASLRFIELGLEDPRHIYSESPATKLYVDPRQYWEAKPNTIQIEAATVWKQMSIANMGLEPVSSAETLHRWVVGSVGLGYNPLKWRARFCRSVEAGSRGLKTAVGRDEDQSDRQRGWGEGGRHCCAAIANGLEEDGRSIDGQNRVNLEAHGWSRCSHEAGPDRAATWPLPPLSSAIRGDIGCLHLLPRVQFKRGKARSAEGSGRLPHTRHAGTERM
ncbi:hypothetical protein CDL15_Pgr005966 [Punica granatum]|uniref:Uncharacterized protein n=1 Tax=Punica granatum TaxID=22663 RepID=A0A218WH01_PUNGR|nr:hypothetical protein CDL15_Pgr005966 [Punica granatum]